jgi:mRNA interferase MazF
MNLIKKVYIKKFDIWNVSKKRVDGERKEVYFSESEVWYCALGVNVGFEQDGIHEQFERPVLILKKWNKDLFVGIPLSTVQKEGKYYYKMQTMVTYSVALLSQVRVLDARRLIRKLDTIDGAERLHIAKEVGALLL